jgi:uncharacterized protein (TIGR03437 family)
MRTKLMLLILAAMPATAQSITIQNPSFETATLPLNIGAGPFSQLVANSTYSQSGGTLANWTASSTTLDAAAGAIASKPGAGWTPAWWAGNNIGYIQLGGAGTASLSQTLTTTLQNGVTYTLSALVGRPINNGLGFNYALQLWAGTTMLASASNFLGLPLNSSGTDSLSYSSGANNPQAGQPLMIVLTSTSAGNSTQGYFDSISLTSSSVSVPTISSGGVVSASAFGGFTSISPGSWIEIYGSNLASDTRGWAQSDFNGVNAPTSLDGTSVSIGGQAAFVDYISPGQVNALVPSNVATGPQSMTVKTSAGTSAAYNILVNPVEPGLLATPTFVVNGTPYAVALFSDGTYVLPVGAVAGLSSRPAKPGDTIILYGVGFGPVTPSIAAGQLAEQSNAVSGLQMSIGGVPAVAAYAGLAPNYTGLYQFNLVVPSVAAGSVPLTFTLGGTAGTQRLSVAVGN